MALPLDSIIFDFIYSEKKKQKRSLCYTWDSNLQNSDPESMRRGATAGGDLLDDLLTPSAGTLRTITLTIIT